jgi:hypothetical protein
VNDAVAVEEGELGGAVGGHGGIIGNRGQGTGNKEPG